MSVLWNLFTTFFKIGLFTFGGGYAMIPLLSAELAKKKRWTTDEELMDYYSIGQCTPGIIAVNVSTFIGYKLKGVSGPRRHGRAFGRHYYSDCQRRQLLYEKRICGACLCRHSNRCDRADFRRGARHVEKGRRQLVSGHHFLPVAAGAGMAVGFAGNGGAGGGGNRSFDQELGR